MISKKVSHIGSHAFAYCEEVTSFTVNEDNQNFKSVEGNLYSKDGTKLIQYAAKNQKTYFEIPENVTIIANCAFTNVVNLKSLVIPNTIVKMGDNQIGSSDCVFHSSRDITLYSEYQKDDIPSGWLQSWYGDSPVVWGCELSADKRRVLSFTKTGNNPEKQSYHYLLNNPPSYIGDYVFMGWFKEPEFINKEETFNLINFNNGNKYYAKWIVNDDLTDFEFYWHSNKDMFFE